MRLLFVSDVSIRAVLGGAERVLFEQATRLAAAGHSVHLITRRRPEHRSRREAIRGVEEIRCDFVPDGGLRSTTKTWRQARRHLARLHALEPFDCLNIHQPLTAHGVVAQASACGIRMVYTCHSLSAEEYLSRHVGQGLTGRLLRRMNAAIRHLIEGRVLRRCDRIVALSRYTREKLQRVHGIPEDRVAVIPGGVDLVRFRPVHDPLAAREELSIPRGRFVLLTVRNLVPRMGLERLVLSMQTVAAAIPHSLLVIGGSGPLGDRLKAMVDRLGLGGNVRLVGFIPEEILHRYYQMADLFVLPSIDLEGFGMVTVEALACGVPVLGTPVGGTHEILARLDERLLLKDGRPESMALGVIDCHRRFHARGEDACRMRQRCRMLAEKCYSWNHNVAALEQILAGARPQAVGPLASLHKETVRP
ncbi:MAG: glycosyltransferase family 4 protein [Desulfobacterales bacterium]